MQPDERNTTDPALTTAPALVTLQNVSKLFGGVHALDDVSFELRRGDVVGLVGDNGAGKSTLVKILSGVFGPSSGEILIEGERETLTPPARAQRHGIETVYQDLALVSSFTVAENFFVGRERSWGRGPKLFQIMNRRSMTSTAASALESLNISIPHLKNRPVERMSGGQRQMAAIARGAFWGERLLLLDEPTAALGVRESHEVLELVGQLSQRGLTMLMVTHNLEHLWSVCNRVIVMRRGRKVADLMSSETTMDEVVAYITGAKGPETISSE
jgi:ABC-type sugar transport system ATPase subunit